MSGLEILGALASAVQLADTCLKITISASELFTRVRGAPETIRTRIAQIEQLIEIARLIEHNSALQTPLIGSVLDRCREDTNNLLGILKKLDTEATARKVVKYWTALLGVTKEKKILGIFERLEERKSSLILCIASINSDLLHAINLQMVTDRQGVKEVVRELPAIRDTARKVTTIFEDLPITSAKVSNLYDELPAISGKITAIHDDIPALAGKMTVIHDELPAIRDALGRLALHQQAHIIGPTSLSTTWAPSLLPFARDEDFVGREDVMVKIDQMFAESKSLRRVGLEGLGGVGKSQIAIEYAYRFWEKSPETRIFWVHAATSARVEQSYRSIANLAKLPGADEPKTNVLSLVCRWLEYEIDCDWLMIVDNADDAAVFFPSADRSIPPGRDHMGTSTALSSYVPQKSRGLILITLRNKDAASQLTGRTDSILKIKQLENDDARDLLRKKLPNDKSDEEDWNALIHALEGLPLAITQAAAYIAMKSPRMTVSKYLEYFRHNEANQISLLSKDSGDLRRDPEVPNAVVMTWQISFNQIKLRNSLAADLLSRMCILDRQGIPRFLIFEDDGDDLEFEDAIGALIGFSFLSSQEDGDNFEMHPLVQLSTRKWLEVHGEIEKRKKEGLTLLSQKFPNGEHSNWTICEALEPHAQVILQYHYASQHCRLERAKILHNIAWFALSQGKYGVARSRIQKAVNTREVFLGPDDEDVLSSRSLLASVLWSEGLWKKQRS